MLSSTTCSAIRRGPAPAEATIPIPASTENSSETAARAHPADDFALDVFVAHQDLATGVRAKKTLDRICGKINLGPCLRVNLWRFELLEDSILWREAVRNASRADILFFSLHGDKPLPAGLCHWLKHWLLLREERPCALVVSLDESHRHSESGRKIVEYLREIGATGDIEVFPYFEPVKAEGIFAPSKRDEKKNQTKSRDKSVAHQMFCEGNGSRWELPTGGEDTIPLAAVGEWRAHSRGWGIND
jgi:hypothetical protein